MPSPKARHANVKVLEGRGNGRDSGGRKIKQPPAFRRLPPEPPDWLSDEAAAEWRRVVPELQRLQLVKPIDAAALAAYCECWSRFVGAQQIINREGLLGTNSQGRVRHPAVAVVEAASKELRGWASEFGLTPAAEVKVSRPEVGDDAEGNTFEAVAG